MATARTRVATPVVSVVMPAFNAASTIEKTITSVLRQTTADLELIVVDDGSSDGTPDLIRELMVGDRRIRLILQANAGPSTARNRGVEAGRGEIIAFIDADDIWRLDHLESHLRALKADPGVGVSFSQCAFIDVDDEPTGETTRAWAGDVALDDILSSNPSGTCSSVVFRRQAFTAAGPLRSDMSYAEDQEWLFRVIRSGWRMRGLPMTTVSYRTSVAGLSARTDRMLEGWRVFMERARLLEPQLVAEHGRAAEFRMHTYFARRAIRTRQPGHVARRHLWAAFSASPQTVARAPLATAALAAACAAPALAEQALSLIKGIATLRRRIGMTPASATRSLHVVRMLRHA